MISDDLTTRDEEGRPARVENPPPGVSGERWAVLLSAGRHFDSIANRGAGKAR